MRIALALIFCIGTALAQSGARALDVGADVPPLAGTDVAGQALDWQRFEGRAVLLFFHAAGARAATSSLSDLAEACEADKRLRRKLALLVVTDGEQGATAVGGALAKSELVHAVTVDADRSGYARYRAVAFPTVFAIDGERRIVHVVRGHGPAATTKAVTAARLAAGLIDREEFEQALKPRARKRSNAGVRVANLVEKMIARGSHDRARKMLQDALQESPGEASLIELAARLEIAAGDGDAAAAHVAELERVAGRRPRSRWLRAEVLLARDDPVAALVEVDGLPATSMRAALIKGDALERLGRHEEAAALYRGVLLREMRRSAGR